MSIFYYKVRDRHTLQLGESDNAVTAPGGLSTPSLSYDTTNTDAPAEGVTNWNADDGTLQVGLPGGSVALQIGQEILIRAKNVSGGQIDNGTPVYVSGATGNNIEIDVADASSQDNNRKTLAVATEDIANNQKGYVTTFGFVRDIDTSGCTEGDELYVAVGGGFTSTKPALPNGVVRVGYCTRSHASEGVIFVNIDSKSVKDILTDSGDLTVRTESGKTLLLDNPVYEDLNFAVVSVGGPVATRPDYVTIDNVVYAEFTNANNQIAGAGNELPHEYKLSSDLRLHIHGFLKSGESIGTTGVEFTIYWAIREQDGVSYTNGSAVFTQPSASLNSVNVNFYDAAGDAHIVTGPDTLGAQMYLTLARTGGDAGDFIVTTYGAHYQIDTMGSRLVGSK